MFPSRARLRGSRRGCLDVLTMSFGTCCCPQAHWRLCGRSRQEAAGATETGKGVPEGYLSSFPGIAEIYGCPHWISTEPKLPVTAGEITAITINVNSVVPDDATIVGRLQKGISPKRHSLDGDSLFQKRLNANYVPRLRL